MRAPFQRLLFPFRKRPTGEFEFAALKRADDGNWQAISGGGEGDETPEQTAVREGIEEAGINDKMKFYRLDSINTIPKHNFQPNQQWPLDLLVVPEYTFAIDCTGFELKLSAEHTRLYWGSFSEMHRQFTWDSNRNALWELHERLQKDLLADRLFNQNH